LAVDGLFSAVSVGRVSTEIVDQIERAIEAGQLGIGDRLPSEREMTRRFGVSRVTVRDALRILEATGLIEVRLGSRGGAYITTPEPARIGNTLARMLMLAAVEPEELDEARHTFEVAVLEFVCARADETDIRELREICDRTQRAIEEGHFHMRYSVEFHVRLAEAAHNRALAMLFESFQNAVLLTLLRAREGSPAHGLRGLEEHRAMIDAIADRDPVGARRLMEEHLERTSDAIRSARRLEAVGRTNEEPS
jgi:GntR family transcriptional regulator, transcriptional repressor for pyruvate dehydrogenase complex